MTDRSVKGTVEIEFKYADGLRDIEALNRVNAVGYGSDFVLKLDLVYNP